MELWFQVNTLNEAVSTEFRDVIKKIQNDKAVKAVVLISSKPDCFIAGADIGSAEIISFINKLLLLSGVYISSYFCHFQATLLSIVSVILLSLLPYFPYALLYIRAGNE